MPHIWKSFADVSGTQGCLKWCWLPLCYWNDQLHQVPGFGPSQIHKAEGTKSGIFVCAWKSWLVGSGCVKATQLWVRAEIKGRREVLWQLKQLSTLVLWFLPHFTCFLFQALVLVPWWAVQKTVCFGHRICVGMTNFPPASLWKCQRRTQCRKHHQWTTSLLKRVVPAI